MAKNFNVKFQGDNKGLVSAVKGIQGSLHGAEKSLKAFKAEVQSLGTSFNKINSAAKSMEASMRKVAEGTDKMGDEARQSAAEVDKLNASLNRMGGTNTNKMFTSMRNGFRDIGRDITRATKLATAFASITGGIQVRRATNEYLEFSSERMQLENITNAGDRPLLKKKLDDSITKSAVAAGVNPAQFIADIKNVISGSLPINITKDTTDAEAFKQITNVASATEKFGIFGKATGASTEDVAVLATRFGISKGYSPEQLRSPEIVDEMLGYIAVLLDESVGSLTELSTAISKPLTVGMDVESATLEGVLSRFARNTKIKGVMLSGRHASALSSAMGNPLGEAKQTATRMRGILRGEKNSEGVLYSFDMGDKKKTAEVKKFLQGFDTSAEVENRLFKVKGEDGKLTRATPEEALANYKGVLDEARSLDLSNSSMLAMLQGKIEVRLGISDAVNGGLEDILNIKEAFGDAEFRGERLTSKLNLVQTTFAQNYAQVAASYVDATNKAFDKTAPSLNAISQALVDMFAGKNTDITAMNEIFNKNLEKIKETNPFLAKMVEYMKSFGNYVAEGGLKEDFIAIVDTIVAVTAAINMLTKAFRVAYESPFVQVFKNMLGDSAGGNLLVGVGLVSLMKTLSIGAVTGLGGLLLAPFTTAGAASGVAAGTAFSAKMKGLGSLAVWGTIGLSIGVGIGKMLDDRRNNGMYSGTKEETLAGEGTIKFKDFNKDQRKLIMAQAEKDTNPDLKGFAVDREKNKLYVRYLKELETGMKQKDFLRKYGSESFNIANLERQDIPSNFIEANIDGYKGSPSATDMSYTTGFMEYLNNNQAALIDLSEHNKTVNEEHQRGLVETTKKVQEFGNAIGLINFLTNPLGSVIRSAAGTPNILSPDPGKG